MAGARLRTASGGGRRASQGGGGLTTPLPGGGRNGPLSPPSQRTGRKKGDIYTKIIAKKNASDDRQGVDVGIRVAGGVRCKGKNKRDKRGKQQPIPIGELFCLDPLANN